MAALSTIIRHAYIAPGSSLPEPEKEGKSSNWLLDKISSAFSNFLSKLALLVHWNGFGTIVSYNGQFLIRGMDGNAYLPKDFRKKYPDLHQAKMNGKDSDYINLFKRNVTMNPWDTSRKDRKEIAKHRAELARLQKPKEITVKEQKAGKRPDTYYHPYYEQQFQEDYETLMKAEPDPKAGPIVKKAGTVVTYSKHEFIIGVGGNAYPPERFKELFPDVHAEKMKSDDEEYINLFKKY